MLAKIEGSFAFTFSQGLYKHQKQMLTILLTFALLFSLVSPTSLVGAQDATENFNYSIRFTVTYVNPNAGTRTWNLTEEDRTISLFMNNAWQSVQLKSTTLFLEARKNDNDGNNIAVLEFPKQQLYAGENVSFTVEYQIVSRPRAIPNISEEDSGTLDDIPQDLKENYTRAEGPWLVNDSQLKDLAHEIAENETNVLKITKSLIGWIKKNINYTIHEVPYYSNETLSAGEGDCDDQAILFITLSRIIGIPSHLQIGPLYLPQKLLVNETHWDNHVQIIQRKIGWHGWAMAYIPPWGWLPIDLTFVPGGFTDPLNAIRYGAVTQQYTIQYMNVSKVDYVAESRQARAFLLENGFSVKLEEEMTQVVQNGVNSRVDPTVVVALVLIMVMVLASSFLIARRWRTHPEETETPTS